MTGDELAARLFAEQGYLVLGSTHPLVIGSLTNADKGAPMSHPLLVKEASSKAEWNKQGALARKISGGALKVHRNCPAAYFYRVEAAD